MTHKGEQILVGDWVTFRFYKDSDPYRGKVAKVIGADGLIEVHQPGNAHTTMVTADGLIGVDRIDASEPVYKLTNKGRAYLDAHAAPVRPLVPSRYAPPPVEGVGPDAPVAVNDRGGKQSASPHRADLLPPQAVLGVARVLKHGADKYGPDNWRSITVAEHLNHALTHALAYLAGDRQDDHLGHFACRSLMALEIELCGVRPKHEPAPAGWVETGDSTRDMTLSP